MSEQHDLVAALQANLALLREVGLRYGIATDKAVADGRSCITPEAVAELNADMLPMVQEQVRVMLLNTKTQILRVETVYQGTINSAAVRIAEILRPAIIANAPQFIMVHNHPSGDPAPSPEDLRVTRKVLGSADLMDIDLLDHVIVARGGLQWLSMKQRSLGGFP